MTDGRFNRPPATLISLACFPWQSSDGHTIGSALPTAYRYRLLAMVFTSKERTYHRRAA